MKYIQFYDPVIHGSMSVLDAASDIADRVSELIADENEAMIDLLVHNIAREIDQARKLKKI